MFCLSVILLFTLILNEFWFFLVSGNYKIKSEFILKTEIEKEIGPETPVAQRIKTIKELSEIVVANRLEEVILDF